MKFASLFSLIGLALIATPALAACPAAPGEPVIVGDIVHAVEVCHTGYASLLDPASKEARIVSYVLTADHSHAHGSRAGMTFKVDALAPPESQGRASDYSASGYDLGHLAPAEDFAWSAELERDTFSMANVEPQLPGLNRQGWERIEEITRAEACRHGEVWIFTGPIYPGIGEIGADKLSVPRGFFKVVVDPKTSWGLAFLAPQADLAKGDAAGKTVAIATVEVAAGIKLPLPEEIDQEKVTAPDDGVLEDYRAGHCKG